MTRRRYRFWMHIVLFAAKRAAATGYDKPGGPGYFPQPPVLFDFTTSNVAPAAITPTYSSGAGTTYRWTHP